MGRSKWSSVKSKGSVALPIAQDEGFSRVFCSEGLLANPDDEICVFNDSSIKSLQESGCFPSTALFFPFNESAKADYFAKDWVCFYEYPFSIGFTFPFPPMISEFFKRTRLAFAQIMPMVWRIFASVQRVNRDYGLEIGIEELAFSYDFQTFGSTRYYFKSKDKAKTLFPKLAVHDRGWKNRFFFVEKDTVGEGVWALRWNREVVNLSELFPAKPDTEQKVESLLKLSEEERAYKPEGVGGSSILKETSSANMSTVSKSATGFCLQDLDQMMDDLDKAETVMKPPVIPKVEGVAARMKKRKAEKGGREAVELEAFAGLEEDVIKKRLLAITSNAIDTLVDRVKDKESDFCRVSQELKAAKKDLKSAFDERDDLKAKNDNLSQENYRLMKELSSIQDAHAAEIEDVKKVFKESAIRSVLEAKIKMMQEFKDGAHVKWDLDRARMIYQKVVGEMTDVGEVSSSLQGVKGKEKEEEEGKEKKDEGDNTAAIATP